MNRKNQLKDLLESSDDELFQKLIDRQEGAEGQSESYVLGIASEPEMQQFHNRFTATYCAASDHKPSGARWKLGRGFLVAVFVMVFLFTVAKAYPKMLNWVIESFDEFIQFHSNTSPEETMELWEDGWVPTYLPDDFRITDVVCGETAKLIEYSNTTGERIVFYQYSTNDNFHLDIENAIQEECQIDGKPAYVIEKEEISTLYWLDTDWSFSIEFPPSIMLDEAVKIAESISPVSNIDEENDYEH